MNYAILWNIHTYIHIWPEANKLKVKAEYWQEMDSTLDLGNLRRVFKRDYWQNCGESIKKSRKVVRHPRMSNNREPLPLLTWKERGGSSYQNSERTTSQAPGPLGGPRQPSKKISGIKDTYISFFSFPVTSYFPPLAKLNRKPENKRIIKAVHLGRLPRAPSRAEMSRSSAGATVRKPTHNTW